MGGGLAVGLAYEAVQLRGAVQQLLCLGAALVRVLCHLFLGHREAPGAVLQLPFYSCAGHVLICRAHGTAVLGLVEMLGLEGLPGVMPCGLAPRQEPGQTLLSSHDLWA